MLSNRKGFTLVKIMILVVISAILIVLMIPRFMAISIESKQGEAKRILKQIYVMERAYYQEFNVYWPAGNAPYEPNGTTIVTADAADPKRFKRIGVYLDPAAARYSYRIEIAADGQSYTATAHCANPGLDDDPTPDTWTMDQNRTLTATSDDATN